MVDNTGCMCVIRDMPTVNTVKYETNGGDDLASFKSAGFQFCPNMKSGDQTGVLVARQEILSGWASVLVADGKVMDREKGNGIKPALKILKRKLAVEEPGANSGCPTHKSLVFGDKVLGLAAFRLGALMGAKVMWGGLVSQPAVAQAGERNITILGDQLVQSILNKPGDDLCPMERLASACKGDSEFYWELCKRLK